MKTTNPIKLQNALHRLMQREQSKPLLQRLKENAFTPLWMSQGAFQEAFRFLQMGQQERSKTATLDKRNTRPGRSRSDRFTEAAVRFLDEKPRERAHQSGRMVLPIALLALGGRVSSMAWIGRMLQKFLPGRKI